MIRAQPLVRYLAAPIEDRRGATTIEYGLVCAMIVLAMLVSFKVVAGGTVGMWTDISTSVLNAH